MAQQSDIRLQIELDDQRMPERITWEAADSGSDGPQEAKAFLLSLWDPKANETLRIDLWNKDMQLEEMNVFMFQTLLHLSDTYLRANKDEDVANDIRDFALRFGEKVQVIRRKEA